MNKSTARQRGFLLAACLCLVACGRGAGQSAAAPPAVTGAAEGAPEGCDPQSVADRLSALFAAINRADSGLVAEYFGESRHAPFEWYSIGHADSTTIGQQNFVAYDFDDLGTYWEERFAQNERLALRSIQFNGWDAARGLVHFGPVVIERTADDVRSGVAEGKGAYHCASQAFIVLSLAMN